MANGVRASLRELPPLVVIDLAGEVTAFADEAITGAYRAASDRNAKHILINFSDVDHLNSAGISTIIGILTQARQVDQVILISGLTPHYRKIFELMELGRYVLVFDSEDAARRSIAS